MNRFIRRLLPTVVLGLTLAAAVGCDSKPKTEQVFSGDAQGVALLIEEMNDARGNPKRANTLFVKGSVPANLRKYVSFAFYIVGKPQVNGAEATAEVSVQSEREGKEVGKQTWTFVKDGEAWKIKSAPLP
jgi:tetrahydromethanopterin S-methyltransferase subunit H